MTLHPAIAALAADPRMTVRVPPPHVPIRKVRAAADAAMHVGARPAMASTLDRTMAADPPVPVRIYRPRPGRAAPAVVFCHGGGFVWGSIDTHDGLCRRLAARSGAVVVSVGYRLSPDHPFPAAERDAREVLRHVRLGAGGLGIDPARIAVAGDSAGAFLAVHATAGAVADGAPPAHLSLAYPALDPLCLGASHAGHADGPVLTSAAMRWFWRCHLPGGAVPELPPLAGFPPATVLVAEHDPLRDEGLAFARALAAAGADARAVTAPGMAHGFLSLPLDAALTAPWEALLGPGAAGPAGSSAPA